MTNSHKSKAKYATCYLCKSHSTKVGTNQIFGKKFSIAYCNNCELFFFSRIPTEKFLHDYYKSRYFHQLRENRLMSLLKKHFSRLRAYSQYKYITDMPNNMTGIRGSKYNKRKVLEIGSGEGHLLHMFSKHGWDVKGLEYNEYMIKKAKRNLGITLEPKDIFSIKKERFDLIIMAHSLEHFVDPSKVLIHCKSLLETGGRIFIEVPDSPLPDKSNIQLHQYLATTHIYNFRRKSLDKIMKKSGLTCSYIAKYSYPIPKMLKSKEKEIAEILIGADNMKLSFMAIMGFILTTKIMTVRYLIRKDPMNCVKMGKEVTALGQNLRVICSKE